MYMPEYLQPTEDSPAQELLTCFWLWALLYIFLLKGLLRSFCNHFKYTDFCLRTVQKWVNFILLFFKYDIYHQFCICLDLIVYDEPGKLYRFTIIYYLLSLLFNTRLHLITQIGTLQNLETACMIYKSLNWSEREVWDMFGIFFLYHPDLRRLLTDYGFSGFPLRKDFPVSGFKELMYADFTKKTEYRPVSLMQELRRTIFEVKWFRQTLIFRNMNLLIYPTLIIYLTIKPNNIFINWYTVSFYGQFIPHYFFTLKSQSFAENATSETQLKNLAILFATTFQTSNISALQTILVLRNFGRFARDRELLADANSSFSWVRRTFFEAIVAENITFSAIIDRSTIPFNGCRLKKTRRKKFKRVKTRVSLLVNERIT